ncbi:hypothetical protein FA15DRAFT_661120 [Coprinopsis marcescibilis]|uniref:Uncharacterized protein n=1 Tax=Coprinopsis marcescibilis TaxID=230819 RepID=A0A5C3KCS2_COPMA|nr:hypothetical protein FA15DRAFT_661120 [Coprinopsis marcescibilis]
MITEQPRMVSSTIDLPTALSRAKSIEWYKNIRAATQVEPQVKRLDSTTQSLQAERAATLTSIIRRYYPTRQSNIREDGVAHHLLLSGTYDLYTWLLTPARHLPYYLVSSKQIVTGCGCENESDCTPHLQRPHRHPKPQLPANVLTAWVSEKVRRCRQPLPRSVRKIGRGALTVEGEGTVDFDPDDQHPPYCLGMSVQMIEDCIDAIKRGRVLWWGIENDTGILPLRIHGPYSQVKLKPNHPFRRTQDGVSNCVLCAGFSGTVVLISYLD